MQQTKILKKSKQMLICLLTYNYGFCCSFGSYHGEGMEIVNNFSQACIKHQYDLQMSYTQNAGEAIAQEIITKTEKIEGNPTWDF